MQSGHKILCSPYIQTNLLYVRGRADAFHMQMLMHWCKYDCPPGGNAKILVLLYLCITILFVKSKYAKIWLSGDAKYFWDWNESFKHKKMKSYPNRLFSIRVG